MLQWNGLIPSWTVWFFIAILAWIGLFTCMSSLLFHQIFKIQSLSFGDSSLGLIPSWTAPMCLQTWFYWTFIITNVAMERFDSFMNSLVFHCNTGMNRAFYLYEFSPFSSNFQNPKPFLWGFLSWIDSFMNSFYVSSNSVLLKFYNHNCCNGPNL